MFVNDDAPPNEEPITAIPTVDDLVEAMGQLTHESLAAALNQPSYLRLPPDPPLHRLARRDGSSVRNEMSGAVTGLVVQADTVSGGIHVHSPEQPRIGAPWQMPSAPSRF